MRTALQQLGFHDCYHMESLIANLERDTGLWMRAVEHKYAGKGTFTKQDWDNLLGQAQACVDLPAALFSAELAEMYPEAKIVILNRDPEKWYDSVLNTIYKVSPDGSIGAKIQSLFCTLFDPLLREWIRLIRTIWKLALPFDHGKEKEKALAWYTSHYDDFRSRIPQADKKRCLEFRIQDGWGPLCAHLGVPIPMMRRDDDDDNSSSQLLVEAPFPWVNDRKFFMENDRSVWTRSMARAADNVLRMVGVAAVTGSVGYMGLRIWKPLAAQVSQA